MPHGRVLKRSSGGAFRLFEGCVLTLFVKGVVSFRSRWQCTYGVFSHGCAVHLFLCKAGRKLTRKTFVLYRVFFLYNESPEATDRLVTADAVQCRVFRGNKPTR